MAVQEQEQRGGLGALHLPNILHPLNFRLNVEDYMRGILYFAGVYICIEMGGGGAPFNPFSSSCGFGGELFNKHHTHALVKAVYLYIHTHTHTRLLFNRVYRCDIKRLCHFEGGGAKQRHLHQRLDNGRLHFNPSTPYPLLSSKGRPLLLDLINSVWASLSYVKSRSPCNLCTI